MSKTKASQALGQGHPPAMVQFMVAMGRYEDDCGIMQDAPPLPDLLSLAVQPAAQLPARLPAWPEEARGVPNIALRSALFGAIRRGPRRYLQREVVASLSDYEIRYTGPRLDQGDLDVWETLLHLARTQALGNRVEITERALLKALGRAYGKSGREWLKNVAARLSANTVEARHKAMNYGGSLVEEFYRDDESGRYVIILNPKMQALFALDQFTLVDWAVRMDLAGHPLAQWLHGFYASHARPYAYSVAKLHELCGSENKSLRDFRRELKASLELVGTACEKHGQAFSSEIKNDLVHIDKQPSKSQRKHLAGKVKKPQRRNAIVPMGELLKPRK